MPELPEVETIKRGLSRMIIGRRVQKVEVRLPKIVSLGPKTVGNVRKSRPTVVRAFISLLKNKKVSGVSRRAKMLLLRFSDHLTLLVHFKMTGQLIVAKKSERNKQVRLFNRSVSPSLPLPHKYTHVIFYFTNGDKMFFNDLRQFGYLRLVKDAELPMVKELADFGPEPLEPEFSLKQLMDGAANRKKISIKQYLMDPRVVAGIGNIYSDEILFCASVRPTRLTKAIDSNEWKKIFHCIPKILKEAIGRGGSSVGDFFHVDGSEGTYGRVHRVYGRQGEKCRICGSTIKAVKMGGRTSCYCPHCQK